MIVVNDVRTVALHERKDVPLPGRHASLTLACHNGFMPDIPGGVVRGKKRVNLADPRQQTRDVRMFHKTILRHAVPVARRTLLYPDALFFPHVGNIQNINGKRQHVLLKRPVSRDVPAHDRRNIVLCPGQKDGGASHSWHRLLLKLGKERIHADALLAHRCGYRLNAAVPDQHHRTNRCGHQQRNIAALQDLNQIGK